MPENDSSERTPDIARGVSRRSALRKGAVAAAAGAGLMAQSAAADEAASATGFVGSWRITVTPDALAAGDTLGPALATFGADGTMISAGSPVIIAPPGSPFPLLIASAGHGTWEATGEQSAAFTFLLLLAEQGGTAHAVVTINGIGDLDASGDTFAGEYTAKVVGQTGQTIAEGHGALSGTRIGVEPMVRPAATPTS